LAPHQKKARRLKAALVFVDESGLLLAPVVRRTWSPCGCSPQLVQRTRHHQKVSVIAALIISPCRRRVRLCFRLHPGGNVDTGKVRAFLGQLCRQIRGPLLLVWDHLHAHRAPRVRAFVQRHRRVHLEWLPPYAPELNPMEYGWSWLKTKPLVNYAAPDASTLARVARRHARRLQHRPRLLWSFIDHSPLPLRHK
jgi:transposase